MIIWNQIRSNHSSLSSQSQRTQTIQWTNQNMKLTQSAGKPVRASYVDLVLLVIGRKNGRAFWASHVALRPWQTRTHCCRHKCFPVCPRAKHLLPTQILCRGHKKCFWFCSETFFVRATNVSQFAQPKKHHGQQCVRDNVSSFARAFKWSNQSQLLFDTQIQTLHHLWRIAFGFVAELKFRGCKE